MKKIISLLVAALSAFSIVSASAVDVTQGGLDLDYETATNGSTHAVIWVERDFPNNLGVVKVAIKRPKTTWSEPITLLSDGAYFVVSRAAVLKNGTVVVLTSNAGLISAFQIGPNNEITSVDELADTPDALRMTIAIYANKNNVTAFGVVVENEESLLYSWDLNTRSGEWIRKLVMPLFTSPVHQACAAEYYDCEYYVNTIRVAGNPAGQISVSAFMNHEWQLTSESVNYISFEVSVSQRRKQSKPYGEPQTLYSWSGAWGGCYGYGTELVTTPKGKTAIRVSENPTCGDDERTNFYVSSKFGRPFLQIDKGFSDNVGDHLYDTSFGTVGENIFVAFRKEYEGEPIEAFIGQVGKLASAKKLGVKDYDIRDLVIKNNRLIILLKKVEADGNVVLSTISNSKKSWKVAKKWKAKRASFNIPDGFRIAGGSSILVAGKKILIFAQYDSIDLEIQYKGVDVIIQ
jgi:hypothetical protein